MRFLPGRLLCLFLIGFLVSACSSGGVAGNGAYALFKLQKGLPALLAHSSLDSFGGGGSRYSGYYVGTQFHEFPEAPKNVSCLQQPSANYSGCWTLWDSYQRFTVPPPPLYSVATQPTVIIRHEYVERKKSKKIARKNKPACVEGGRCEEMEEN